MRLVMSPSVDLAVIDVELQAEPVAADRLDDRGALRLGVEEIARHVAVIDRLDHQLHAGWLRLLGRPGEVGGIDAGGGRPATRRPARCPPCSAPACSPARRHSRAPSSPPRGTRAWRPGRLASPRSPFAQSPGGMLNSAWVSPSPSSRLRSSAWRMLVREQELHALEPRLARGGEAVEERHLVEHHGQVGGQAWHGGPSPEMRAGGYKRAGGMTSA